MKQYTLVLLPAVLIPSTAVAFLLLSQWLGKELGYVLGFLFYWLFWCLLIPRALLGRNGIQSLFDESNPLWQRKNWPLVLLLALTAFGALFGYFIPNVSQMPPALILLAVPVATINGLCEELLWRGLYVRAFPGQLVWGLLYPTLGFALWHLAPQLVFPGAGTRWALVGMSFLLGLCYGVVAFRTGSMKWTAVSHSVNGILAFGGAIAPSVLTLLRNG